jgi:hypothetical protein
MIEASDIRQARDAQVPRRLMNAMQGVLGV